MSANLVPAFFKRSYNDKRRIIPNWNKEFFDPEKGLERNYLYSLHMLVQTIQIDSTTCEEYDDLLACGWFRGGGIIYRNEIVCISEQLYSVKHIRVPLVNFTPGKKHRKMLRRNKELFQVGISDPEVNDRKEELYSGQLNRFKAFVHVTLGDNMSAGRHDGEFETKELCVYDQGNLIAVSYFDVSTKSAASIMCLFDQSYKKYSLGIYTMLLEMEYAASLGVEYYYPGYVLDRPSPFDYKLTIGECQWMSQDGVWQLLRDLPDIKTHAQHIREKMAELQVKLTLRGYTSVFKIYPYFTVGQVMREHPDLLRIPCFYEVEKDGESWCVSYDSELDQFVIFDTCLASELEFTQHLELSDDYRNNDVYDLRLLKSNFYRPFEEEILPGNLQSENYFVNESV